MASTTQWHVHDNCGIEVSGISLASISATRIEEVKRQFAQHGAVFFRGVDKEAPFGPQEHIEFCKKIGDININRFFDHMPDYPEIAIVEKTPGQREAIGQAFHADHTYDTAPALGSKFNP